MKRSDLQALLDLALLPAFGLGAIISGFGMLAAIAAMAGALVFMGRFAWLGVVWGFLAACIAIYNATMCIEAMNGGSARTMVRFVLLSVATVATCPFFW